MSSRQFPLVPSGARNLRLRCFASLSMTQNQEVGAAGGRVERIPLLEGYSTSALIARIVGKR